MTEKCINCGKETENCYPTCQKCRWREPLHQHLFGIFGWIVGILVCLILLIGLVLAFYTLVTTAINQPNINPDLLDEICHKITGDNSTIADITWSTEFIDELICIKTIGITEGLQNEMEK